MNKQKVLEIDFRHFWHSGTGSSSGTHLDAVTAKDSKGLPFLPGKHIKGLLRHAWHRAETWGWVDELPLPAGPAENWETLLFGSRDLPGGRFKTLPGMLFVDDAVLTDAEQQWLQAQPELKPHLYQELYSTALDEQGSAVNQSLRGIEVVVPVRLHAQVSLEFSATEPSHRAQQNNLLATPTIWQTMDQVLSLVDQLGASRSRGLGEACLSLHERELQQ